MSNSIPGPVLLRSASSVANEHPIPNATAGGGHTLLRSELSVVSGLEILPPGFRGLDLYRSLRVYTHLLPHWGPVGWPPSAVVLRN